MAYDNSKVYYLLHGFASPILQDRVGVKPMTPHSIFVLSFGVYKPDTKMNMTTFPFRGFFKTMFLITVPVNGSKKEGNLLLTFYIICPNYR